MILGISWYHICISWYWRSQQPRQTSDPQGTRGLWKVSIAGSCTVTSRLLMVAQPSHWNMGMLDLEANSADAFFGGSSCEASEEWVSAFGDFECQKYGCSGAMWPYKLKKTPHWLHKSQILIISFAIPASFSHWWNLLNSSLAVSSQGNSTSDTEIPIPLKNIIYLGGGFKYFHFHPEPLGNDPILTSIFLNCFGSTTKHHIFIYIIFRFHRWFSGLPIRGLQADLALPHH